MSTEATWPPPATEGRPWHVERLPDDELSGKLTAFEVRSVPLWGREVLIDRESRVYCPDCWRFVSVAELGSVINGHPVGLPFRAGRWTWPMDLEHEPHEPRREEGF